MHLTIKERVELVLMSGADGATNRSVAKKFNRIYPDREPISHTTVGRLILKFREIGSVLDKPKSDYSRVSDETRRRVIEKVESSPMKSIRRSSSELGVPRNWIGRRGTVEWAPRSPDLTPMDFYFWGHLKQIVYSTRIADVDQLRQQIIRGCNLINGNSDLLDKVYGNFEHRLELCINANGEHFEHL